MQLEMALENDEFLDFISAFGMAAWSDDAKPTLSLNVTSHPKRTPDQRSIEHLGGVAFTVSILLPALKILAGVIKTYLDTRKTQLEVRSAGKKISISGPSASVEKIMAQLRELDG